MCKDSRTPCLLCKRKLENHLGQNFICHEAWTYYQIIWKQTVYARRKREQTFFVPYFLKSRLFEEGVTGQGAVDIVLGKGGGMHTKGMIK